MPEAGAVPSADPAAAGSMSDVVDALRVLIGPASPVRAVARRARVDHLAVRRLFAGQGIPWPEFVRVVVAYDPVRRDAWIAAWERGVRADPGGRAEHAHDPEFTPGHVTRRPVLTTRERVYVASASLAAAAAAAAGVILPD